jgi:hypothetical protein
MWRCVCFSALLPAIWIAAGCQSARYVSKGPDEGTVAMTADTPANRRAAEKLMTAHFPGGYDVVYEYEEPIGETTRRVTNAAGRMGPPAGVQPAGAYQTVPYGPGVGRRRSRIETVDKTEWRIRYRRKGAVASSPEGGTSIADILPRM